MGHKVREKNLVKTRGETSDFSRLTFETNCYVKVQQNPKFYRSSTLCVMLCYKLYVRCDCTWIYLLGLYTPSRYIPHEVQSFIVHIWCVYGIVSRWQSSKEHFFFGLVCFNSIFFLSQIFSILCHTTSLHSHTVVKIRVCCTHIYIRYFFFRWCVSMKYTILVVGFLVIRKLIGFSSKRTLETRDC